MMHSKKKSTTVRAKRKGRFSLLRSSWYRKNKDKTKVYFQAVQTFFVFMSISLILLHYTNKQYTMCCKGAKTLTIPTGGTGKISAVSAGEGPRDS